MLYGFAYGSAKVAFTHAYATPTPTPGFKDAKDFTHALILAWFGTIGRRSWKLPMQTQSGSSVQGPSRLSKAGRAKVSATFYVAAVVAKRYDAHINALCGRLAAHGKFTVSVLCAAMRKRVHLRFGALKTRQPYQANYVATA